MQWCLSIPFRSNPGEIFSFKCLTNTQFQGHTDWFWVDTDLSPTLTGVSRWKEDWQSATVVNSTLAVDPTIRLPGFDLHRRQWSLLNRFWTGQGHCNVCHKKWGFTDNELCDCGEIQTMSHIVNSCPLTKFDGSLLRLHEADEAAVEYYRFTLQNMPCCLLRKMYIQQQ